MNDTLLFTQNSNTFLDIFSTMGMIFSWLFFNFIYIAPPVLFFIFVRIWLSYVRTRFLSEQEVILLEIRLPTEVMKTPAAMQAVFEGLWQKGGESTFIDRLWTGKVRTWFSIEMVSKEGQVQLYIWTRESMRRLVERTFYAHYPDTEILEGEDYALDFPFSFEKYEMSGFDFKLNESPGIPIKTYRDYELDKSSIKEEQKTDPLSHIFEFLGSMHTGEHLWIQILFRADRAEDITWGPFRNEKDLKTIATDLIKEIRSKPEQTIFFPNGTEGKVLSDTQLKRIEAINRILLSSAHWDVGIRSLYIAEKEHFDGTTIGGMSTMWQPFNSPGFNGIGTEPSRGPEKFAYPWQDFQDIRKNKEKIKLFESYQNRGWFHQPYYFKPLLMTSEELATLFHLSGTVAKTPTLHRIQSSRAQSPSNLPM
jgi:hypothetical protein